MSRFYVISRLPPTEYSIGKISLLAIGTRPEIRMIIQLKIPEQIHVASGKFAIPFLALNPAFRSFEANEILRAVSRTRIVALFEYRNRTSYPDGAVTYEFLAISLLVPKISMGPLIHSNADLSCIARAAPSVRLPPL